LLSLPNELRERLAHELRYAVTKMGEARAPLEKLYYFSVFYGEATRVLNWHWDRDLALIWMVTQNVHNTITARVHAISQGEPVVRLSEAFFDTLTLESVALVDYIEKQADDNELCRIMGRLAELVYATTGNGFYLLSKGNLKL